MSQFSCRYRYNGSNKIITLRANEHEKSFYYCNHYNVYSLLGLSITPRELQTSRLGLEL